MSLKMAPIRIVTTSLFNAKVYIIYEWIIFLPKKVSGQELGIKDIFWFISQG